jgi:serine/threonine protein kinase
MTRLNTAKGSVFKDNPVLRTFVGRGAFGQVYSAIDQTTGHAFAVKVISLDKCDDVDAKRGSVHREIQIMKRLSHVSNIYLLP